MKLPSTETKKIILKTVDPWDQRGIRIYGNGDVIVRQGECMDVLFKLLARL